MQTHKWQVKGFWRGKGRPQHTWWGEVPEEM